MTDLIRHLTRRCRAWLIAVAAILLVTSILEAGHNHGTITPEDSHCILCQHACNLDQALVNSAGFILPLLLSLFISISVKLFIPQAHHYFAAIRAPPAVPAP